MLTLFSNYKRSVSKNLVQRDVEKAKTNVTHPLD